MNISGIQHATGTVERAIFVSAENVRLGAEAAGDLAAALRGAADVPHRLG